MLTFGLTYSGARRCYSSIHNLGVTNVEVLENSSPCELMRFRGEVVETSSDVLFFSTSKPEKVHIVCKSVVKVA